MLIAVTAAPAVGAPELPRDAARIDASAIDADDAPLSIGASLTETTGKKPLPKSRVTVDIALVAKAMLDRPWASETIETVNGEAYGFRVEEHYHAPGSGFVPEGYHKGVTVYYFER